MVAIDRSIISRWPSEPVPVKNDAVQTCHARIVAARISHQARRKKTLGASLRVGFRVSSTILRLVGRSLRRRSVASLVVG